MMVRSQLLAIFACLALCSVLVSGGSKKMAKKEWGKRMFGRLMQKSLAKRNRIDVTEAGNIVTPNPYPASARDAYIIAAPSGETVILTLNEFDLVSTPNCEDDAVYIYDGATFQAPLLAGPLCGLLAELDQARFISTGNQILIWFRCETNPTNERGFNITVAFSGSSNVSPSESIEQETSAEQETSSEQATSNVINYGQGTSDVTPYGQLFISPEGANLDVNYLITAPADNVIQMEIHSLEIQDTDGCTADRLLVYEGDSEEAPLRATLCGSITSTNLLSTGNQFYVNYVTNDDDVTSSFAFDIVYHPAALLECPSLLSVMSNSTLQSPGYEEGIYGDNLNCLWRLKAPIGKNLQLRIVELDIESSEEDTCVNDFLRITDGEQTIEMCGSEEMPEDTFVMGDDVTLLFHSDEAVSVGRWKIEVEHLI